MTFLPSNEEREEEIRVTLLEILEQIKIMNEHLRVVTGEEFTAEDITDGGI